MKISSMMNTELTTVSPELDFASLFAAHAGSGSRQTYVVDSAGKLLGIITNLDVLGRMVPSYLTSALASSLADGAELIRKRYADCLGLHASDLMVREVVSLRPEDTLIEANVALREGRFNALPVLDTQGRLVGDIDRKGLLRHIAAGICGLTMQP